MLPRYGSLPISSISRYFIVELFVNNHSFQVEAALLVTQEPTHKPSSVSCCGAACRGEGGRYRIEFYFPNVTKLHGIVSSYLSLDCMCLQNGPAPRHGYIHQKRNNAWSHLILKSSVKLLCNCMNIKKVIPKMNLQ